MTKCGALRDMRIGKATDDAFMRDLGSKEGLMRARFADIMTRCTQTSEVRVMMGDSVVKSDHTFNPEMAADALAVITSSLGAWDVQDVTTTRNEDKRRLFTKFSVSESGLRLSGHFSLQYHVLLYYVPNQRVLDCQKELASLIDDTGGHEERRASLADQIVKSKLESAGVSSTGEQEVFEALYNDESLRKEIEADIDARTDPREASLAEKKAGLYAELDTHLLEVYQTSQVLIDEARLVGGEEGYVFSLDIEADGGGFDSSLVTEETRAAILARMSQLGGALDGA